MKTPGAGYDVFVRRDELMRKICVLVLALLFCLSEAAWAGVVTAFGQGGSERDALHAAMRSAVEREIGVLIDSSTYIKNYRVINDDIYAHTEGYIAGYEVLEKNYANGIHSVTIRADVRSDLLSTNLMTKLQKQAMIKANLEDPRISVIVMDDGGRENAYLENVIINGLSESGFSRIVDLAGVNSATKRRIASASFEGDRATAQMMRSEFGADYIVLGRLEKTGGVPFVEDYPFIGGIGKTAVSISVRMLNVNTGEIVYAGSFAGSSPGHGQRAEQMAMKKATRRLVREISRSALKKAANPSQHVTVIVTRGLFQTMGEAYERLRSLPGVSNVYVRRAVGGGLQADVDYDGTAYDLARAMECEGMAILEMSSEFIRI